uniref:Uncharacterized protein n=1 Tax=Fagus sylvatica TaxID=28930 RepID=A0A2N9F5J0_FAGSY
MVVTTSTAVATSSSSAVPTVANAAPRLSSAGMVVATSTAVATSSSSAVPTATNAAPRGFEVGKTHSAAPLLRHGGLGVDLNPSRFGSTPAITPIDLISSTVLLSISLLFVHSKIEN